MAKHACAYAAADIHMNRFLRKSENIEVSVATLPIELMFVFLKKQNIDFFQFRVSSSIMKQWKMKIMN